MPFPLIRPLGPEDEPGASHLLDVELAGRMQARLGEVHDVLALPGLVAAVDEEVIGVATCDREGRR